MSVVKPQLNNPNSVVIDLDPVEKEILVKEASSLGLDFYDYIKRKITTNYSDSDFTQNSKTQSKPPKKQLSPQAKKILEHFNTPEHKAFAKEIREKMPELYNMTPQEEKEYIRREKAKKYGVEY